MPIVTHLGHAMKVTGRPSSARRGVPAVSVLVPAYNEEHSISRVVSDLQDVLAGSRYQFEVVVIDDGSDDDTASRAQQAGARVLRHASNKGYGAALKTGIRHAKHALICTTDADGTYPVDRIPDLVAAATEADADMVVGARTGSSVAIPMMRRPAKWMIGKLANLMASESIPDVNSGLRIFRRKVALLFFNYLPDGFSFTTTITLAMLSNGYLVSYVPINYYRRVGRSKIRPVRDTLNFVQLILRIALYFGPLKIFLPLSGIIALLGVAWGTFSLLVLGRLADVSTVVIVMTALQIAVIGLLAELVNRRLPDYHREED